MPPANPKAPTLKLALSLAILLPAFALPAAAPEARADPGGSERLTPAPGFSPVTQSFTPLAPTQDAKPPPKPIPVPPPHLPPPFSSPLTGTPQVLDREESPAAAAAAPTAATSVAAPAPQPPQSAQGAASLEAPVVRYASTEINVRPRPDQAARRIDVLDEGTRLEVVSGVINGQWVKIARHGRVLGYVSADYLLPHPPKPH